MPELSEDEKFAQATALHNIANTNVLVCLVTMLVDKGVLDSRNIERISAGFAKPFDQTDCSTNNLAQTVVQRFDDAMGQLLAEMRNRGG